MQLCFIFSFEMLISLVLRSTLLLFLSHHSLTQEWHSQEDFRPVYYSLNEVGVREKRQAENTANDSPDGLNKRFINDSMARRHDSVSDQRNDVIDFTKYGEKESSDLEYQESDRSRENRNHTDETGRWYGRDVENESLNRNDASRSSDHESRIEDTVDEKEGASEATSLDDSVVKQLRSKKPTYEEDDMNGNETSSNFSDSEDVSDDIENDKEELADRKSVNNDSKQMHPTTKISNEERGSGALKGSETSSSLSGGEDPNEDIDNEKEEVSGRKSVGNDAKQMLSKKKISDEGRSRDALNDKEAPSSLFDNEEYSENNARDEGEPINEAKQVYSIRPDQEKGHDSEALNGKHGNETSGSLINSEKRSGDIEGDREEQSERKFDDDDDARQERSNEALFEEDHSTEALNSNETSSNFFDKEEESGESKDYRKELSKRKFKDDKDARQERSNETFFEEDHSTEALNSDETSSNLFDNEGHSAEQRQETPERKPENEEDAKQVHSKKAIHKKDHAGTEVLSVNEKLFDNEEQEHEVGNGEELSERKFKDKDKKQGRSKQPLDKEPEYWGSKTLNSNKRSSHFFDNEEQSGDNEDYRERNSETLFQDDDDAKDLKRANHENEHVSKALNGIETLMDNEEQNADNVDSREKHSETRFEDDNDAIQGQSKKEIHEKIHFSEGNETSSNLSDNEDQSGDIEDDKQGKSEEKFVDKSGVKRAHSKKAITDEDDSHGSLKEKGKQQKGNAKKDDEIEETHGQREEKEYRADYQSDRFFHDDDDEEQEEKNDDEEPVKRQNLGMKVPLST